MSPDDITIMQLPTRPRSRLYYYQGNFYHPLDMARDIAERVRFKIRQFKKDNAAMVAADRAHPDYKNPVELFDAAIAFSDVEK